MQIAATICWVSLDTRVFILRQVPKAELNESLIKLLRRVVRVRGRQKSYVVLRIALAFISNLSLLFHALAGKFLLHTHFKTHSHLTC